MHLPKVHAESSIPVLRQLIRDYPLGILTTAIPSPNFPLLQSTHIPFLLDVKDESNEDELGRLRGHLARQNPQAKALIETLSTADSTSTNNVLEQEVLVLFTAPANHYVTPQFYVETKPATGKVVPTWNYAAVQAYGKAKIFYDSKSDESSAFLQKQVEDLTQHTETSIMGYTGVEGRPSSWTVSQAPDNYVQIMKKNIIGIQIDIERLEGKFKMSQEKQQGDRDGVAQGFVKLGTEVGEEMSEMVRQRSDLKNSTLEK